MKGDYLHQTKLLQRYRQILKRKKLTNREIIMLHEHFMTMAEILLSDYNEKRKSKINQGDSSNKLDEMNQRNIIK